MKQAEGLLRLFEYSLGTRESSEVEKDMVAWCSETFFVSQLVSVDSWSETQTMENVLREVVDFKA